MSMKITRLMASAVRFAQAGVGAIWRWVQEKLRESVSVEDFGATGDGVADDTAAFAAAITHLIGIGGGRLELTKPAYLLGGIAGADGVLDGILIPFVAGADDGATSVSIEIVGKSRDTRLLAGNNNMNVLRLSASYCAVKNLAIHANGKTGVTGLAMIPQDTSAPAEHSQQSFNQVENLYISRCAEGIVMQCGGRGGAYYNCFKNIHIHGGNQDGTRGLYLKSGIGSFGVPSNVNRNQFYSVRLGYLNTGIEIESGDTNTFFGCSAEGVEVGTGPNATPVAVYIHDVDGNGRGCENNRFNGFTAEACTRDLVCMNPRSVFVGGLMLASKTTVTANFATLGTMAGVHDISGMPSIIGGTVLNGGSLPTGLDPLQFPVGVMSKTYPSADKGHAFKAHALTAANVQGINSIADARSYYSMSDKWVDFGFRFSFNPTSSASVIKIPLPATAFAALYSDYAINPPLEVPVALFCGASRAIGTMRFNYNGGAAGTLLEVNLIGTSWNTTAGNNNIVNGHIRYRAA